MGFARGAKTRVLGALLWMMAAIVTVVLLDRSTSQTVNPRPSESPADPSVAPTKERASLSVESSFVVSRWRVSMGTNDLVAESSDPSRWKGTLPGVGEGERWEVFVEAESDELYSDHRHALLITLQGGGEKFEQTVWGQGDVSALLDVDASLGRASR